MWIFDLMCFRLATIVNVMITSSDHELLLRTCTKVRSVLFLPRTVHLTVFVPGRRHFPACRRNVFGGSARRCRPARHG
jgi:hypothetical protein